MNLVTFRNLTGYRMEKFCTLITLNLILLPQSLLLGFEIVVYESHEKGSYQKAIRLHFCEIDVQAFRRDISIYVPHSIICFFFLFGQVVSALITGLHHPLKPERQIFFSFYCYFPGRLRHYLMGTTTLNAL